jgi:integrase
VRHVSLTTQGVALFKRLSKGRTPTATMLVTPEGTPWTKRQYGLAWAKACTAAKIEGAVFYDLRRTFGSLLANASANTSTIAHSLGHVDERMTKRSYAHLLDATVAGELQKKLPKFKTSRKGEAA